MYRLAYFIRHGHADSSITEDGRPVLYGPEAHLSQLGMQQMQFLAERLTGEETRLKKIVSSPTQRALESAQVLSSRLDIPLITNEGFRVADVPMSIGKPLDEIKTVFIPGNESVGAVSLRMLQAFQAELDKISDGEAFGIVSHKESLAPFFFLFEHGRIPEPEELDLRIAQGTALKMVIDEQGIILEKETIDPQEGSINKETE